jgi:hypothetical protein
VTPALDPGRPRRLETRDEAAEAVRAARAKEATESRRANRASEATEPAAGGNPILGHPDRPGHDHAGVLGHAEAAQRDGTPGSVSIVADRNTDNADRMTESADRNTDNADRMTESADRIPGSADRTPGYADSPPGSGDPSTTPTSETPSTRPTSPTFIGRAAAGYSVGGRLGELLEPVFAGEPPVGDAVAAIFRRAEAARRRRSRWVVAAGIVVVVLVFGLGYGLTTVLLPAPPGPVTTGPVEIAPPSDPVLNVLRPVLSPSRLRIVPREPARGDGWRQYLVLTASGRPHGLIEVSVYAAPEGLCFPVLADKGACARPDRASDDVEYVRYSFDQDQDWQVNQAIARRLSDGRVVVVQATGERGTGTATGGRPPLSAVLTAKTAADPRLAAAFGEGESCDGPDPACPILRVPVHVVG